MGNRCSSCNRFVSLEQAEPSVDTIEVNDLGEVRATVWLSLECAECGQEVASAELEVAFPDSYELREHIGAHQDAEEEFTLEVEEECTPYPVDEYRGKGQRKTHHYGAYLQATVNCSCGAKFELEATEYVDAGSFMES
jgi:hypothetical protein